MGVSVCLQNLLAAVECCGDLGRWWGLWVTSYRVKSGVLKEDMVFRPLVRSECVRECYTGL